MPVLKWMGNPYETAAGRKRQRGRRYQMVIREYESGDLRFLAELFCETVHAVNARDYTEEQLDAWADGTVDLEKWDLSFRQHHTFVAVVNGQIAGFGDMDDTGYLDRLYVHKDFQHRGIATALCDKMEETVRALRFITHASITAKPFFISAFSACALKPLSLNSFRLTGPSFNKVRICACTLAFMFLTSASSPSFVAASAGISP